MHSSIGVGIIGCGSVAQWKYLPSFRQLPEVDCRAFLGGQAEACRAEYGAPGAAVCTSLEELLVRQDIDMVCVCTPNHSHAAITIAALRSGKHVLCEKPMATGLKDAQAMVQAAEQSGKLLSIGHQARFFSSAQALRRDIAAGALGDLYFARASMVRRLGIPTWGHFTNPALQGGGCLIDLGTHAIDLALWLMDDWTPAYCVGSCFQKRSDQPTAANRWGVWESASFHVEDAAFGQVVMKSGAVLSIDTSWALHVPADREDHLLLSGTRAGAEWTPAAYSRNGVENEQLYQQTRSFSPDEECANLAQLRDFVDAIRTGGTPLVTPRQSLAVSQILSGLYQSAWESRPIIFEEDCTCTKKK